MYDGEFVNIIIIFRMLKNQKVKLLWDIFLSGGFALFRTYLKRT